MCKLSAPLCDFMVKNLRQTELSIRHLHKTKILFGLINESIQYFKIFYLCVWGV